MEYTGSWRLGAVCKATQLLGQSDFLPMALHTAYHGFFLSFLLPTFCQQNLTLLFISVVTFCVVCLVVINSNLVLHNSKSDYLYSHASDLWFLMCPALLLWILCDLNDPWKQFCFISKCKSKGPAQVLQCTKFSLTLRFIIHFSPHLYIHPCFQLPIHLLHVCAFIHLPSLLPLHLSFLPHFKVSIHPSTQQIHTENLLCLRYRSKP